MKKRYPLHLPTHRLPAMLTALVGLLLLASCRTGQKGEDEEDAQRVLTVSIEPVRFLTERIAGDAFRVSCMVPRGSSPETYEPSPRQLTDIARSEAYLRVGPLDFEEAWMERLTAGAPDMVVTDISKGVEFITETAVHHGNHTHAGGRDPHIWTSPANMRLMAANIRDALSRLSPTDSAEFRTRWMALDSLIVETDNRIRALLSTEGAERAFLLYHPSLSYFARDYGLQWLCIEEGGKEPSPARMKELTDECRRMGIRVCFVQRGFDTRSAQGIAADTHTRIVETDPLSYEWDKELVKTATQLVKHGTEDN